MSSATTSPAEVKLDDRSEPKNLDPRSLLANWANNGDEWMRFIVSGVITTGRPLDDSTIETAYALFRQEKALDKRKLPAVPPLSVTARQEQAAPPLVLTRLSNVEGVNALVSHSVIEPHEGLTILYGENGAGKTGYSRIFKALADSRTADTILGNIEENSNQEPSAVLDYKLGDIRETLTWHGEQGVTPFTRMSIFDTPSVTTHVDQDLDYVYIPASLALFTHVNVAIQELIARVEKATVALGSGNSALLKLFERGSSVYPLVESLGASTDLVALKSKSREGADAEKEVEELTQTVAALRANTIASQVAAMKSEVRVLDQASKVVVALSSFDAEAYNAAISRRRQLSKDYETFRRDLFRSADLPAEPDETWAQFIGSGQVYRQHLSELEVHDVDRCLYCRQPLTDESRDLLARYSAYLQDKISADIKTVDADIETLKKDLAGLQSNELTVFINQYKEDDERPTYFKHIEVILEQLRLANQTIDTGGTFNLEVNVLSSPYKDVHKTLINTVHAIESLEAQQQNRSSLLAEKQYELLELTDAIELGKSWQLIERQVLAAKESDRLRTLKRPMTQAVRAVTELSKTASDVLVNQSFDALFAEECEALRAPSLKVQFVGRAGKAHRRKVMTGKHKPSKVFSEGEQKVLALADFLAEARLAGITAPVVFDDPVSSLDHRRISEVAHRVVGLAESHQVIVFTHDILFASMLLNLSEKSKRCTLYQIVSEGGKGQVTPATGLRTDTLAAIKGRISNAINLAEAQVGEIQEDLVRMAYSHVRAWCEVFTEEELLRGVTKRYRANVQMTTLPSINGQRLDEIGPKVTLIFNEACRYIDGHSHPMVTQYRKPTLTGLKKHWEELIALKKLNDKKN